MVSSRMLLLSASCWLLVVVGCCEEQTHEDIFKTPEEKELIEALQDVLEKLKSKQLPSTEKKQSWLPSCDAGQLCALRKGSRIGKLCGCPTGTVCNFTVLKCL
ncbi:cocaine- and amphetamine-regulated transcript protein-like [Cynoglossus semilaevis]|uniref:CART prepropeptide n=1 Tax=Cynoglossus semilaevis TaxID=244447 RepID=A0A3P8UFJ9_CYNSE|nr:cocaine- and amphetamine-regulated transcript protein-like [Cynoglossus semilaevis]